VYKEDETQILRPRKNISYTPFFMLHCFLLSDARTQKSRLKYESDLYYELPNRYKTYKT